MNIRSNIILAFFIICWQVNKAQKNNRVIVTVDVSGYVGKLPASKFKEWEGENTIVPEVLKSHSQGLENMGAEYLIFSNEGNAIEPKNDSLPGRLRKIWRNKANIQNNIYTWEFKTNEPRLIANESLLGGTYLILPGDSIHVTFHNGKRSFSGEGATKLQITQEIILYNKNLHVPVKLGSFYEINLPIFFKLNSYLNQKLNESLAILEPAYSKLDIYEYNWIKATILQDIEYKRFLYLTVAWQGKNNNPNLYDSLSDYSKVWDSTMYQPNALWLRSPEIQNMPGIGSIGDSKSFHMIELRRKFNFLMPDSVANVPVFKKQFYYKLKDSYSGLYRERLLCYFLKEEFLQELGSYNWFVQGIMNDYYATPGFPAYKNWMKKLEKEENDRAKGISRSGPAPWFSANDQQGLDYSMKRTEGKLTIVNFWYTGCEPCKLVARDLKSLQEKYKRDTNVLFLNVSVDKDKQIWMNSIKEGKYVPPVGVQLYTGGKGKEHEMVKDFFVNSYPTIRIYDGVIYGKRGHVVFDAKEPFATALNEKQLSAIIEPMLSKFDDGPYVFHENGKIKAYTIDDDKAKEISADQLKSSTDDFGKPLQFSLQKQIFVPPSTYPAASKLLVLSDIEGNFTAFKKLLQANGVMDENFNWKFGKGRLVFAGDMFDRGDQVTECLWLVYALEEKAKAAGGMVHFILGNHEIMNLQGNHYYVVDKYKKNAELMGKTLTQLYNEDSELGRWLRSKNIVEKIGDLLFMHGGVSSELNNTPVTIAEINELARPHYADTTRLFADAKLNTIMSSEVGPFWFRGYYQGTPGESMIDSTFKKFDVKHIVTGHTIVADVITAHYGGKIINTDVPHASGKSEALLIEGPNFYRVNTEGKKVLLFTDDKRKVSGK